jgi:hypothetical protein
MGRLVQDALEDGFLPLVKGGSCHYEAGHEAALLFDPSLRAMVGG